jgi:hypothetical protein
MVFGDNENSGIEKKHGVWKEKNSYQTSRASDVPAQNNNEAHNILEFIFAILFIFFHQLQFCQNIIFVT